MVIWITGKAKAGKTTMAEALQKVMPGSLILDGDAVRQQFPTTFDEAGRRENILRIAKMAGIAEKQGIPVIVACVSPKREWREEARKMFRQSILIYVPGGILWPNTEYEEPTPDELRMKMREILQ